MDGTMLRGTVLAALLLLSAAIGTAADPAPDGGDVAGGCWEVAIPEPLPGQGPPATPLTTPAGGIDRVCRMVGRPPPMSNANTTELPPPLPDVAEAAPDPEPAQPEAVELPALADAAPQDANDTGEAGPEQPVPVEAAVPGSSLPGSAAPPEEPTPLSHKVDPLPTRKGARMEVGLAEWVVPLALAAGVAASLFARLWAVAIAFFTRIGPERARRHPVRQRLLRHLGEHPGARLKDLVAVGGASRNNVAYHLAVLERNRLVSSVTLSKARHYVLGGAQGPPVAAALLSNRRRRSIAGYVASHPGCPQRDVCEALSLRPSRVHEQVRILEGAGLLRRQPRGRNVLLEATALLSQALVLPPWAAPAA
jgi:DNA-binding MarR family transcriptional regulator